MAKIMYHLNDAGDALPCDANIVECRYSANGHFPSQTEARIHYESNNNPFKKIRVARDKKPDSSPFGKDGLTENVRVFTQELQQYSDLIANYYKYRMTGLNEDHLIPKTPGKLANLMSREPEVMKWAWKRLDFKTVSKLYAEAVKRFYVNNVFNMEDIDCMPEDDEIENMIMRGHKRQLAYKQQQRQK